jgi:hypothetical protein
MPLWHARASAPAGFRDLVHSTWPDLAIQCGAATEHPTVPERRRRHHIAGSSLIRLLMSVCSDRDPGVGTWAQIWRHGRRRR